MMKRRCMLVLIGAYGLTTSSLAAQTTIRVVDRDSVPIPYALVSVGKSAPRATDVSGRILLKEQVGETLPLKVQRIGYRPFEAAARRGTAEGDFIVLLEALPRGLDTVRTIASRETPVSRTGFYDRMERVRTGAIIGEFITPEELELRNASQISDMLRGRRSITMQRVVPQPPAKGRPRMVALGRGGGCTMTVLLDGQRLNNMYQGQPVGAPTSLRQGAQQQGSRDDSADGIDDIAGIREIMAIEIYPSTANAPAELIPLTGNGSCGIIALWTGPRQ